jgi:hypothetical protein
VQKGAAVKTETPIVSSIVDQLTVLGIWCWRQNSGSVPTRGGYFHGAPKGTPDVLGTLDGRLFGIEVKTAKGEERKTQEAWAAKAKLNGVLYGVARTPGEARELIAEWRKAQKRTQ